MVVSALPFSKPASVGGALSARIRAGDRYFPGSRRFRGTLRHFIAGPIESRLARIVSRDVAKGIVSDALLLAFGLRRERMSALAFAPLLSRRGTLDEYGCSPCSAPPIGTISCSHPRRPRRSKSLMRSRLCPWHSISRAGSKRPDCGSKLQTRAFFACRRPHPSRVRPEVRGPRVHLRLLIRLFESGICEERD